jgi:hypothetical protein
MALLTAGCNQQQAKLADHAGGAPLKVSAGAPAIHKACGNNANNYLPAVWINIPNPGQPTLPGTVMNRYTTDQSGNEPEGASQGIVHPMANAHTEADFAAGNLLRENNPPGFLLIQLDISQATGWTFDTTDTVTTDDASHGQMFCVKDKVFVSPDRKIARFYVLATPPSNGKPVTGAYKFNATGPNGQKLLLAIDPEVQNEG